MNKHLVSYNGKESFEVDLSKLKELTVPGRVTLYICRGSSWELSDEELKKLKEHPLGCMCHVHDMTKKKVKVKEESEKEPEKDSNDESKKDSKSKKILKKKSS